jgi:carbamoyl-phosphate synthase large subunit
VNGPAFRLAVSGLHRGENPQPGAALIRSLRRYHPNCSIVGLCYDLMESGIYAEDGPDDSFLVPYPTAGGAAYLERLDAIRARSPFDLLVPTLDAEIEVLGHLVPELGARGIRTCLPTPALFRRRAKSALPELARAAGVRTPHTRSASDLAGAMDAAAEMPFPLVVKGAYYDAQIVHTAAALRAAAGRFLAEWGAPVIVQQHVEGAEFNLLGLGDGAGSWRGHCCIRKTQLSDRGKGLGGIVVADADLSAQGARLIRALRWPGPFELEFIRETDSGVLFLIEMNPRFPAWVDFPAQLGANYAAALVRMIQGQPGVPLPGCAPGAFYLRHQIEVIGDMRHYAALLAGEGRPLPHSLAA